PPCGRCRAPAGPGWSGPAKSRATAWSCPRLPGGALQPVDQAVVRAEPAPPDRFEAEPAIEAVRVLVRGQRVDDDRLDSRLGETGVDGQGHHAASVAAAEGVGGADPDVQRPQVRLDVPPV